MSEMTMNPGAQKAVLIFESEDGSVAVATIYDPVLRASFEDVHAGEYMGSRLAETTLTYRGMTYEAFPVKNEDLMKHAADVYAQARKDALLKEAETVPTMASQEDMMAMNFRTHEAANAAVFLAGVQAGARQVQFADAHFQKLSEEAVLHAYHAAYNAVNSLAYAKAGSKAHKGLKRARRALSELRQPIIEAFRAKWGDQ